MKYVELTVGPILIEDVNYEAGAVVLVADTKADELVSAGAGRYTDSTTYENINVSLLSDSVSPEPPIRQVVNPSDALAPSVVQNPGLADLVTAAHKIEELPRSGTAAGIVPVKTGLDGDATPEAAVQTTGAIDGTDPTDPVSKNPEATDEGRAKAQARFGGRTAATKPAASASRKSGKAD